MARKYNPEDAELVKFFQWVRWQQNGDSRLSLIHHVSNERRCSWEAGKRLKAKGQLSGVPDITVPIPIGRACGAYIEMKYGKNVLSESQAQFLQIAASLGHKTYVAYSADLAIEWLQNYLQGKV